MASSSSRARCSSSEEEDVGEVAFSHIDLIREEGVITAMKKVTLVS